MSGKMTTDETTQPIAPLFMAIVAFARRRGAPEPLFLQPGYWSQCFEHEGGEWCVVINGRDCIQYCEPQGTIGCNVWPYGAAVFRNGWLVASVAAQGGRCLGMTEEQIMAAIESQAAAV